MNIQRIILILLVANLLVTAAGSYVHFTLLGDIQHSLKAMPGGDRNGPAQISPEDAKEYTFFPVEKVIVSVQHEGREHYFVLDLVLQADKKLDVKKLEKVDPMVRNSVVANLSAMSFTELRNMPINDLQSRLEQTLFDDFASKKVLAPFSHVLVSKMIVQ